MTVPRFGLLSILILTLCSICACEVQKDDELNQSSSKEKKQPFLPSEHHVSEQFLKFLPTVSDDLDLNTEIESLGGRGYKIVMGDLNNDSLIDAIVDYSLLPDFEMTGGGSAIGEIAGLIYLKNTGDSLIVAAHTQELVGNIGSRNELQKIESGTIYLEMLEYAPDDGRCCPSIPTTTMIRIKDGEFFLR